METEEKLKRDTIILFSLAIFSFTMAYILHGSPFLVALIIFGMLFSILFVNAFFQWLAFKLI